MFYTNNAKNDSHVVVHVVLETLLLLLNAYWLVASKTLRTLCIVGGLVFSAVVGFLFTRYAFTDTALLSAVSFVSHIVLTIAGIVGMLYRYRISQADTLFADSGFLVCVAVLLYNGAQFPVALFEDLLRKSVSDLFYIGWAILQWSTIAYHLILTRAAWKLKTS